MTSEKMTPEAAIIELNRCKIEGYAPVDVDRRNKAIEMAKAALRKKIPQKPDNTFEMVESITAGTCPSCVGLTSKYECFCRHCGQALDWGTV